MTFSVATDDQFTTLHFFARHAEIKGLILELCNKSIDHRQNAPYSTTDIVAKMTKWQNDLDVCLDGFEETNATINNAYLQMTLFILSQENIIALYRPLLSAQKKTVYGDSALQSCIGASRAIIRTLYQYLGKVAAPIMTTDKPLPAPLICPSFTWATWQSAFIVIYAGTHGQLPGLDGKRLVMTREHRAK